jgi:hypothetical protein
MAVEETRAGAKSGSRGGGSPQALTDTRSIPAGRNREARDDMTETVRE